MIEWYIGINTGFSASVGMWGKYFKRHLSIELYELYTKTYSSCEMLWTSIFVASELFRTVANVVGKHFGYDYNQSDDDNMMQYLINMKNNLL